MRHPETQSADTQSTETQSPETQHSGTQDIQICREHGDLMLELAQGLLDDDDAAIAERLRQECDGCHAWWNQTFSDEALATIDSAVANAFDHFEGRRRMEPIHWLAAAAVTFVLGASLLSGGLDEPTQTPVQMAEQQEIAPALEEAVQPAADDLHDTAYAPEATHASSTLIFSGGFESNDLSGWTSTGRDQT